MNFETYREIHIIAAIELAQEIHGDLAKFDNPYERIGEFINFEEWFPYSMEESTIEWAAKVTECIDELLMEVG